MAEIAALEKGLADAFDGPEAEPLSLAALAEVAPELWTKLVFTPHPTAQRLTFATNAADIWSALQDGIEAPEAAMLPAPAGAIVWRRGHVARLRVLAAADFEALQFARAEGSFGALCTRLVDRLGADDGIARAGALLADWIGNELLTRVSGIRQS